MSQGANQIPGVPPLSGAALVSAANGALAALLTQYSGPSAPSSPSSQQGWVDTSAGTIWLLKVWDGSAWIVEGVYDSSVHQFYGPIGGGTATLASVTGTVDLGSVNQSQITITGTPTITSFGSSALPGQVKYVKFAGALQITNSANIVCPGGYNIQTVAGASLVVVYQGGGIWIVWQYPAMKLNSAHMYLGVDATGIASFTFTKINIDTVDYDLDGICDTTNKRIRPNVPGTYLCIFNEDTAGSLSGLQLICIAKNGTRILNTGPSAPAGAGDSRQTITALVPMNGTTDFLEMQVLAQLSGGTATVFSGISVTGMFVIRVGP